jgi:hypothetical protein
MSEEAVEQEDQEVLEISYTPIGDEPFGAAEMFAQGATALDLAAVLALENKDYDALLKVASGWSKLARTIAGIELEPDEPKKVQKFGFSKEIEEEEDNGKTDSKSDGKDDIQSQGRLRSYRIRSIRSRARTGR